MKRALFIGRFQPFHLGHLSVVKEAMEKCDQVIIGIGSAEQSYLPDNPFTAGERFELIDSALREEGVSAEKYCILPVRNINNYALWPNHVDALVPEYDEVYTGSKIVKQLFERQEKHKVVDVKMLEGICGAEVRNRILQDQNWEEMVPKKVAELLKKWNASKRLKDIS
jgi:nicotinamide-nucleotide adenylyltransferase